MLPWGLESFGSDLAGMAAKRMRSSHPSVYRPPADNYPLNKANQLIADIYKHHTSPKDTSGKASKVVGVGNGMIGKAIDGEGETLLYVLELNAEGGNLG